MPSSSIFTGLSGEISLRFWRFESDFFSSLSFSSSSSPSSSVLSLLPPSPPSPLPPLPPLPRRKMPRMSPLN